MHAAVIPACRAESDCGNLGLLGKAGLRSLLRVLRLPHNSGVTIVHHFVQLLTIYRRLAHVWDVSTLQY